MSIVRKRISSFPQNVHIVEADSKLSTYALGEMSNAAIIYGTKTGVELSCRGIPVIVCGEAWIRNKGLTIDVASPSDYNRVLNSLPLANRMPDEQVDLARRYAYHYFFRRLIPNPLFTQITEGEKKKLYYRASRFLRGLRGSHHAYRKRKDFENEIVPGKTPEIDAICEAILKNKPFIYDELTQSSG